jgi:hypothetical protein
MIVPPNNFYHSGFTGGNLIRAQVNLTCKPDEGVLFLGARILFKDSIISPPMDDRKRTPGLAPPPHRNK